MSSAGPAAAGAGPLPLDLKPMEAESVERLPDEAGWQFEPKYDGFRALVHVAGGEARIQSRNARPLGRYFPEVEAAFAALEETDLVLDGELVIPGEAFETLQLRLHPAASRILLLSRQHPAELIAFDMLARRGEAMLDRPLAQRRTALEAFAADHPGLGCFRLGIATGAPATARRWLGQAGLDGIVAKRIDGRYEPGRRAMLKFKQWRTVDCVVGGLYRNEATGAVDSLLLGLYAADGRLNFVGHARVGRDGAEIGTLLEPLVGGAGFSGRAPGGRSRWSAKERQVVPLRPELVVEVSADHISSEAMRHGARLLRWRTDKLPEACTMDQIL